MQEDAGVNTAASESLANLFFSVGKRKPRCPYKLWGCVTNSEGCTPEQLAPWTHLSQLISCQPRRSAVSLATLTFIIAPVVLPPPQPQGYSPPGCFVTLLCCCGLPWLAAMLDGASRHKFVHIYGAIPSVQTDRCSICSLFCLFHFVKCPWVP